MAPSRDKGILQKQTDIADEKFDTDVKNEHGRGYFFPALGGNFGNFGFVIQKEEFLA